MKSRMPPNVETTLSLSSLAVAVGEEAGTLEEVNELPSGGRGVMAIRLHEGEAMLALQPLGADLRVAAYGRGDKRITLTVKPGDIQHYRGSRARTGRVLQGSFKRVEGFEG